MYTTKKIAVRRDAFTLVEMMVVIAIILALAALAAAFAPRVNDNQKMTRAVDLLEQWLLTAKMRAKRDGLSTGLRFVQAPGDPVGVYSQFQYIQQPQPLAGSPGGGILQAAANGTVTFVLGTVDFTLGQFPGSTLWNQWLVQPGDNLEINGGGVYVIGGYLGTTPQNTLLLGIPNPFPPLPPPALPTVTAPSAYDNALSISIPTTNYRILRQPRILIGEEPLTLPNNYPVPVSSTVTFASTFSVPDTSVPQNQTCNVLPGFSGYPEILFSPTGAVVGTNAAKSTIWISVWDTTMDILDPNRVGIVGIQSRSGFIGAYGVSLSPLPAPPYLPNTFDPLYFVRTARQSGL